VAPAAMSSTPKPLIVPLTQVIEPVTVKLALLAPLIVPEFSRVVTLIDWLGKLSVEPLSTFIDWVTWTGMAVAPW
jgi:hypothetical protein